MHRIDAAGATVDNLFTEGNPALSIPATVVSDDWLNDVQEEIANFIEGQGVALEKGTQDQLETALLSLLAAGGTNYKLDPLQNNLANQVITGLSFDKTKTKAVIIPYDVHRSTDDSNVQETGHLYVTHDSKDDVWRIEKMYGLDDAGVTFNITAAGQVRVSTSNIAGASYAGQFRASGITKIAL